MVERNRSRVGITAKVKKGDGPSSRGPRCTKVIKKHRCPGRIDKNGRCDRCGTKHPMCMVGRPNRMW